MPQTYLRRLTRWQAEQQREVIALVHAAAYRSTEHRDEGRTEFLRSFEQEVRHDGFDMVVADAGELIGCAYGHRLERNEVGRTDVPAELTMRVKEFPAPGQVFVLTELLVLPAFRRQGVATRLGDLLLSRHDEDLVMTVVEENSPSAGIREVLRAWDWKELPGAEPLSPAVWVRGPQR
ncbi:GNAT family N-acetyltransferase [Streptomyces sp. NPDC006552]|uniref:GNAT family N-acetyltransferase n=1 Tax=Streptomyces sp. NPDC006552 TaxID=3157179 RepID=UPI0033B43E6B